MEDWNDYTEHRVPFSAKFSAGHGLDNYKYVSTSLSWLAFTLTNAVFFFVNPCQPNHSLNIVNDCFVSLNPIMIIKLKSAHLEHRYKMSQNGIFWLVVMIKMKGINSNILTLNDYEINKIMKLMAWLFICHSIVSIYLKMINYTVLLASLEKSTLSTSHHSYLLFIKLLSFYISICRFPLFFS